jgi:hypothetical protein
MDPLKEKSPDVYPVTRDCIKLFESAYAKAPSEVSSFYTPNLLRRMALYVDRSIFYFDLYNLWGATMAIDRSSSLYNMRSVVHVFGPLLLQELEGPLKAVLGITHFLLGVDNRESLRWPDCLYRNAADRASGKQHALGHLIRQIESRAGRYPHIVETMVAFKREEEKLDFDVLRNSLGHSDYFLLKEGGKLVVHLEAGKNSQQIEVEEFLSVYTGIRDLVRGLNVSVNLMMHRLEQRREARGA